LLLPAETMTAMMTAMMIEANDMDIPYRRNT
jgi:hypothetical protein